LIRYLEKNGSRGLPFFDAAENVRPQEPRKKNMKNKKTVFKRKRFFSMQEGARRDNAG
jgi:hypothetical protein